MAAMHFKQVQRFMLAKKYFGVRGTFSLLLFNWGDCLIDAF